jgi:hypothetical protein
MPFAAGKFCDRSLMQFFAVFVAHWKEEKDRIFKKVE